MLTFTAARLYRSLFMAIFFVCCSYGLCISRCSWPSSSSAAHMDYVSLMLSFVAIFFMTCICIPSHPNQTANAYPDLI
jgi:hypothetical protein